MEKEKSEVANIMSLKLEGPTKYKNFIEDLEKRYGNK